MLKLTRTDQAWLEAINAERRKDQSGAISYEVFEVIMDKLEKEWFNLVRPPSLNTCQELRVLDQAYTSACITYARGGLKVRSM